MSRHNPSTWMGSNLSALLRDAVHRNLGRCSPTDVWAPAVNVYQLPGRLEVCVDLAGVAKESLDVRVEPGRLVLRGSRAAPEPAERSEGPMRIVCMEIDYGPFHREIIIPPEVSLDEVQSNYESGLLWITLPMSSRG